MGAGNLLLVGVMFAVFVVLVVGLVMMIKGGDASRKHSNKLMSLRVVLQGVALAVLGVLFLLSDKG